MQAPLTHLGTPHGPVSVTLLVHCSLVLQALGSGLPTVVVTQLGSVRSAADKGTCTPLLSEAVCSPGA